MLLATASLGCQSVGTRTPGVDNFAQVDPTLFRGAQPTRAGVETLKSKGVKSIINLRDDPNPDEPTWAADARMQYVHIPMNAAKVEPARIEAFLKSVETLPRPIFIHCRLGRDRTGLSVAVYRIVVEKKSREDALNELYAHGYHWAIYPGIARYVRSFDVACYLPPGYLPGTSS